MRKKVKGKTSELVMICPRCKSVNISPDKENPLKFSLGAPLLYICGKCRHSGYNFPQIPLRELANFEKEVDKKHLRITKKDESELVDTSYGAFEVGFIWKFSGPLLLMAGFVLLFSKLGLLGTVLLSYAINPLNSLYNLIATLIYTELAAVIFIALGAFMIYATYFRKHGHPGRKLTKKHP
ncbi:hypothetical protein HYY74_08340 [Candidatus Woesearchaeota archaeon]|nr:hypothetical protein [Candidatus Woesearchaeota archaeon]